MLYVLYAVLAILIVFIIVVAVRTALFVPKKAVTPVETEVVFDREKAVKNLQELLKCKTVSYHDSSLEDDAEFEKLKALLPKLYPNVVSNCSLKEFEGRALLFHWKGKKSENPVVLMSHYDVVPVDEEGWDKPAFEGIIEDGILWGRGVIDTKATFNAALTAADTLIADGFVPESDLYLAFSGGEEVNGIGAIKIVDWFEENGIEPELVLDEGGAVVEGVFPGVKAPCGLIGIAEKGMMNLEYSCKSSGGHASAPKPHTPVGIVSKACCRVERHPFKYHVSAPVREMFDTLGRHSNLLYKIIFANLWCFGWAIDLLGKMSGGDINALIRTTVAFTQASASPAPNVIPPEAKLVSNSRINPGETVDSAEEYIRKAVNDPSVKVTRLAGINPSRISRTDCVGYERVACAVASTWKGCIVSPYLMVQCSDSRYYGRISDRVYRFSAMDMTTEERRTVHGHNEHIRIEAIERSVEFYIRLIKG